MRPGRGERLYEHDDTATSSLPRTSAKGGMNRVTTTKKNEGTRQMKGQEWAAPELVSPFPRRHDRRDPHATTPSYKSQR